MSAAALIAAGVGGATTLISPATAAVGPTGSGFTVTPGDLAFILKQIKISEHHAATLTPSNPCGTLVGPGPDQIPDRLTSYGLRTVDGSCNNLFPGREKFAAADVPFPRLSTPVFRDAEPSPGTPLPAQASSSYKQKLAGNMVFDSQPRLISNLIVDQTATNPAALAAAANPVRSQGNPASAWPCGGTPPPSPPTPPPCTPVGKTLFIPNVTTDVGLSPPYNSLFTFFGQFFDHGVDQTVKSGGTVFVPLRADDPLRTVGPDGVAGTGDEVPDSQAFMVLTRAQNQPGPDGQLGTADDIQDANNTDSPWVDQSQTYTSHSSHQAFLREYVLNGSNRPVSTGKLLGGLPAGQTYAGSPDGQSGMATWASVKLQARTKLGLLLRDSDVTNIPMLAADPYGKFIPGPARGLPQYVTATGLVEGDLANPVAPPANVLHFDTPFLTDIAHNAEPNPGLTPDADNTPSADFKAQPPGTYDNELLDAHFCAGDGRVNENIALTTVHQIFHSEHDRLVDYIKGVLLADAASDAAGGTATGRAALPEWQLPTAQNPAGWNGERLFQAARFVTEMEYQHLVFEEFARKIQPAVRPFHVYSPDINPAIPAEFAHAVYRFGHSMLDDDVARTNTDPATGAVTGHNDVPLLTAFLNPPEFFHNGGSPAYTPEQAAGAVIMGTSDQIGNELDEFVTETLRNNLLGLPLDLPTLNMTRARDAGIPPLNQVRRDIFAQTNDGQLAPYTSWTDFGEHLKHRESLINFVAAYGTHPSITGVSRIDEKRAAARAIVDPQTGDVQPPDAFDFMNSTGAYASNPDGTVTTGLESVDLWVGGLAEVTNLFGGLLGSTMNYVFQSTLENLQDGDRLYYLNRTPGMNLRTQLEGNSFAELMQRNTDGTNTLKADAFATADCKFQLANLGNTAAAFSANGSTVADDPTTDCDESLLLLRKPDGTIQYRSTNTVDPPGINGQSVYNGDTSVNRVAGGNDNDTFWGGPGNDIIEGQGGDDVALGGDGNDTLTDLDGADTLKGGPGNDAIDTGPGDDISMGGDGQDFMNGGQNDNEAFAGPGNDFMIAGAGADAVFGDGGDDWIEGGSGQDLLQGDHGGPFFDDPAEAAPGNDIFVGQVGENDYDAEGGDDLMAQNAAIDRNAGAAGFDWAFHQYDTVGADDDMAINNNLGGLPIPVVVNRDRWQESEGDSGSAFDDLIKGDNMIPFQQGSTFGVGVAGGFTGCDALDQAGLDRIPGLAAIVPLNSGTDAQANSAAGVGHIAGLRCPLSGAFWGAGNILLGGAGSDTLEGRGGDDIIDGDRVLSVRIDVRSAPNGGGTLLGSTDLMEHQYLRDGAGNLTGPTLQQAVFAGTVDAGNLVAARAVTIPASPGSIDTAVFSGPRANYTITPSTTDPTRVTVTDNVGADGSDTLYNVERLKFPNGDGTFTVLTVAPSGTFTPASLTFASQTTGTTSAAQTVTLSNTGLRNLVLTGLTLSGTDAAQFVRPAGTAGGTCTATSNLAPSGSAGSSCTISVQFRPTTPGTKNALIHVTDNNGGVAGSTQDVPLTGTANAPQPVAGVNPASLAFGNQSVNVTSTPARTVTLSNTGAAALTIASITFTGTNASEFTRSGGTCPTVANGTLAAGGSCTIGVVFRPTATGARAGNMVVTDNSNNIAGSTQTVTLTGTGVNSAISVSCGTQTGCNNAGQTVNFGNNSTSILGVLGVNRTLTVTSSGGAGSVLTIAAGAITVTGTNANNFAIQNNNCSNVSLAPGATCTFVVHFRALTPVGAKSASARIVSNAPTSPTLFGLTGNATA